MKTKLLLFFVLALAGTVKADPEPVVYYDHGVILHQIPGPYGGKYGPPPPVIYVQPQPVRRWSWWPWFFNFLAN